MKIGIVLPEAPAYSETFFNSKIRGLIESGFEVIVFSGSRASEKYNFEHAGAYPVYKSKKLKQLLLTLFVISFTFLIQPGRVIKLYKLERKSGRSLNQSMKSIYFNSHILQKNVDWLHFGFATMSLNRENVANAIGARMGVSFRGYDLNIYPLKNPGCYDLLWNNVDKVHSISNYLYEKALRLGLPGNIGKEIITPAIDFSVFKVKADLGKIKSPLQILTVGRLNWIKDYETALSAMKILKEKKVNFIYSIIGEGSELERLRFAVHQMKLEDNVLFLGKLAHTEINRKMAESDIYLQTSMQEGFCVSVLEAQASGLLCVVSNADGLQENVIDNETGFIVEKRKPGKFADKIIEIIKMTDEERMQIAISARNRVEQDFKIEDQKIKFKNFFGDQIDG
ncbi:MAG: glycosyltransferase family 4 protein [bacterium]